MKKIFIVLIILLVLAGCIGAPKEMVSSEVLNDPCSAITAEQLESICGFEKVVYRPKEPWPLPIASCIYYYVEDGENHSFLTTHFEKSTISYKDHKLAILNQSDDVEVHMIGKEGLGIGDNSLLQKIYTIDKDKITVYEAMVFKGSSMFSIAIYDAHGNRTKCFSGDDAIKIAQRMYSNFDGN